MHSWTNLGGSEPTTCLVVQQRETFEAARRRPGEVQQQYHHPAPLAPLQAGGDEDEDECERAFATQGSDNPWSRVVAKTGTDANRTNEHGTTKEISMHPTRETTPCIRETVASTDQVRKNGAGAVTEQAPTRVVCLVCLARSNSKTQASS